MCRKFTFKSDKMSPEEYENLIFDVAKLLLPAFIMVHKESLGGREGMYIALLRKKGDKENVIERVKTRLLGKIPTEKLIEKEALAKEKVCRSFINNFGKDQSGIDSSNIELSSFETQNLEKRQFGGGITVADFYMSGSGFPAGHDMKFMTHIALFVGQLTFHRANEIRTRGIDQQIESVRN